MQYNGYRFILKTCASSECEVTGNSGGIHRSYERDLTGLDLRPGARVFDLKEMPLFNFTVVEANKGSLVLKTSFQHSKYESQFEIGYAEPSHREKFGFGRYEYSFTLIFERAR